MYILFWRGFVVFILFSPRSGLCTIREKAGTSNWVLVRLRSIRSLPRPPSIVSFLFPKMCDVTNERTYGKKIRLLKYPYAVNARDLKNL